MLGEQTLIKKGHRQNHQMTAVRKNPLRINNPKSPSIRSPLEMGSVELGATSTLNNSSGISPTHKKHALVVSGIEGGSSRPNSSLPIPPTTNKNSVTSLNKFTSLTPPVNKTHSLFSDADIQSRNNSRPSSATSTKGRKVINELVGLPNLAQQVSSIVEPNIMSPTNADRESITTTRNLRSSFGASRPPSAKLGISNTHVASTSTISPAHHNQPSTTTFQTSTNNINTSQTINNTNNNSHLNEEKLPHVRPTSVKKSTFTESTTTNNHHPTTNHASSTAALHEIPSQITTQQTTTRSSSLKSDSSPVITPSTPESSSLSYFKIKKVQRGKGVNDKKPLKVPIVPKTRELKLENGGFLNDLQATTLTNEKDEEDDLQILTKNIAHHRNSNQHLIEESPVTPITPNSPELSFTPVIENRKKPLKFTDRDISRINDYTELTPPPQNNNKDRIPTPVLKVQEDEDTPKDIPEEQESPEATRETMRQLKLLEIFPNGLDSQNKKIKYQQHNDMDMSYKEVISELKVLTSRVSMLRRNEQGRKNSFKNVYNFQNDSLAMDDINNVEIEKMEKRMRRLNYYRKIMTAGLAGWKEYKTERDSYVALRRSSLVEEQGFDEMSKEDEVVEIRRFDDEYRRFKQRLNPEISTKVAKAIEQVDPQSAAMSILENMVLSKSEKIKTEEDKQLQKEKLTAEIIRWKSRWSPFGTPSMSRTTSILSSLEGKSESIDIADADEVFDVEDVSYEEKEEAQSEDDESDDEGDFEIIILNDLQTEDDGFFLTSTMNENEETEEKMLNQVDPRKLLKAIVAASRKPVSKAQSKA
ncbi:predicted protein [Naegleria gruberi]|uniref:Predicted protein n=1 Tax=Naegleria gruberi TaxID=5762 RepID=D2VY02_NAEGR|nr:uncharacterized protein NAEGRDRAFT_81651 [Naegleria gruberi]EFC38237.1 predicted protein [Naegleria gruberi]|eukprot:XP_002670981.1 predicted protein [Naegleria gruberi strain NEG-M]